MPATQCGVVQAMPGRMLCGERVKECAGAAQSVAVDALRDGVRGLRVSTPSGVQRTRNGCWRRVASLCVATVSVGKHDGVLYGCCAKCNSFVVYPIANGRLDVVKGVNGSVVGCGVSKEFVARDVVSMCGGSEVKLKEDGRDASDETLRNCVGATHSDVVRLVV